MHTCLCTGVSDSVSHRTALGSCNDDKDTFLCLVGLSWGLNDTGHGKLLEWPQALLKHPCQVIYNLSQTVGWENLGWIQTQRSVMLSSLEVTPFFLSVPLPASRSTAPRGGSRLRLAPRPHQ